MAHPKGFEPLTSAFGVDFWQFSGLVATCIGSQKSIQINEFSCIA